MNLFREAYFRLKNSLLTKNQIIDIVNWYNWPRGEVANTSVCKTEIRGCKSRRGLRYFNARVVKLVYTRDLKFRGIYSVRVRVPPRAHQRKLRILITYYYIQLANPASSKVIGFPFYMGILINKKGRYHAPFLFVKNSILIPSPS